MADRLTRVIYREVLRYAQVVDRSARRHGGSFNFMDSYLKREGLPTKPTVRGIMEGRGFYAQLVRERFRAPDGSLEQAFAVLRGGPELSRAAEELADWSDCREEIYGRRLGDAHARILELEEELESEMGLGEELDAGQGAEPWGESSDAAAAAFTDGLRRVGGSASRSVIDDDVQLDLMLRGAVTIARLLDPYGPVGPSIPGSPGHFGASSAEAVSESESESEAESESPPPAQAADPFAHVEASLQAIIADLTSCNDNGDADGNGDGNGNGDNRDSASGLPSGLPSSGLGRRWRDQPSSPPSPSPSPSPSSPPSSSSSSSSSSFFDRLQRLTTYLSNEHGFDPPPVNTPMARTHSNIWAALNTKEGLPIVLSLIYMSVARGVGIRLRPINFPGTFLLQVGEDIPTSSSVGSGGSGGSSSGGGSGGVNSIPSNAGSDAGSDAAAGNNSSDDQCDDGVADGSDGDDDGDGDGDGDDSVNAAGGGDVDVLEGEWWAVYAGFGVEKIRVAVVDASNDPDTDHTSGLVVRGIKIHGDDYVPSGETTFEFHAPLVGGGSDGNGDGGNGGDDGDGRGGAEEGERGGEASREKESARAREMERGSPRAKVDGDYFDRKARRAQAFDEEVLEGGQWYDGSIQVAGLGFEVRLGGCFELAGFVVCLSSPLTEQGATSIAAASLLIGVATSVATSVATPVATPAAAAAAAAAAATAAAASSNSPPIHPHLPPPASSLLVAPSTSPPPLRIRIWSLRACTCLTRTRRRCIPPTDSSSTSGGAMPVIRGRCT